MGSYSCSYSCFFRREEKRCCRARYGARCERGLGAHARVDYDSSAATPATQTRLMQYLLPFPSGRLWPRCVPSTLTVSPCAACPTTRTFSQT